MTEPTEQEVTIGRAAKRAGVPVSILRSLCDEGVVAGVRRNGGHWYLPVDAIPTRAAVRETLVRRYRAEVAAAQVAGRGAYAEVEAIQLDLAEAADDADATQVLGDDVRVAACNQSPLEAAIMELRRASLWVVVLHRQIRLLDDDDPEM